MNQGQSQLTVDQLLEMIESSGHDTTYWVAHLLARVLNVERALAVQFVASQPPSRVATAAALKKPFGQ